ncbi:iron-containing alcohol dehydrogenase [Oleiharenicola lentus]|jgi:alcohol dehydrogenase class IV|uniref:Iron-containing alcohol dehydrogenase n=1 Tax=Oleiharenicola lentus TaxID=2508720 RepID=A0A4Q1C489_9BACT|nr:iron-containing alcohol dehydrogenase [Oleiharenicola lentus]RXK53085.1 iron-containing alcohol dehydrogenase [Oleiharenicola lentus]
MRFEFATAGRIVFGPGTLREVGSLARSLGRHAFVVTGRDPARAEPLLELLTAASVAHTCFAVSGEPTTDAVTAATVHARAADCDFVIGFGGGSALDAAKAVAALLTNPGDLLDYLEVVGRAQPLVRPAAPCLAIPTTAGTGAEVTRNAVLASPTHRCKASLRDLSMLPRIALVDPELTRDLPPAITAATGLDALTQLIEPYVSCRANPMTDALCVGALPFAARSLRRACDNGRDDAARADLAFASLCSGQALANAGLGIVHGFAAPLGGMFPAPHGAVCAALLPHAMAANLAAARTRQPTGNTVRRYDEVARLLTGRPHATADDGVAWVHALVAALSIPRLSTYGVTPADVPLVVEKAAAASSTKSNPLPLTTAELTPILSASL